MVVDDLDDFYDPQLKRANLEAMKSAGDYDFYAVDIRDSSRLEQVFQTAQPDAVIHLAARAGVRPSLLYPALYTSVNVDGTLCLLELSRKYEVQRFVFASSSSVYGQFNRVPFSEDDPTSKPLSVYAATKAAGEGLAFTYSHLYQLPIICLRIFSLRPSATPRFGDPKICPAHSRGK